MYKVTIRVNFGRNGFIKSTTKRTVGASALITTTTTTITTTTTTTAKTKSTTTTSSPSPVTHLQARWRSQLPETETPLLRSWNRKWWRRLNFRHRCQQKLLTGWWGNDQWAYAFITHGIYGLPTYIAFSLHKYVCRTLFNEFQDNDLLLFFSSPPGGATPGGKTQQVDPRDGWVCQTCTLLNIPTRPG
jgi:hypothetical protein